MSVTAAIDGRDRVILYLDEVDAAIYLRDIMQETWLRAHDYGAKEIADALTEALAR